MNLIEISHSLVGDWYTTKQAVWKGKITYAISAVQLALFGDAEIREGNYKSVYSSAESKFWFSHLQFHKIHINTEIEGIV